MTVEKPKPKQLLRPITTGTNSSTNQSEFLAVTCNSLEAQEKSRIHGAIGFGFASHWLKNWREFFKPITKHSNRNHVITNDRRADCSHTFRSAEISYVLARCARGKIKANNMADIEEETLLQANLFLLLVLKRRQVTPASLRLPFYALFCYN